MAENESGQEKTEAPSTRKKSEAREKGQVAKSIEVNTALILLTGITFFYFAGSHILQSIILFWQNYLSQAANFEINEKNIWALYISISFKIIKIIGPFLLTIMVVGLIANIMQVGFIWSGESLAPKMEKLNIVEGFKRLVSPRSFVELLKGVFKLAIIGLVVGLTLKSKIDIFFRMMDETVGHILSFLTATSGEVVLKVGIVLIFLAAADYAFQRWEFEKSLKMTKEEAKEENKMVEGNPQIKARIREMQRAAARRRMMSQIPEADVVITNPIHYAVALKYNPGEFTAPVIIAKGERKIALKIKEIAARHQVPIVEDPPLAQLLFKKGEIGQEIPIDAYQAVAEVLTYVYQLQNRSFNLNS